MNGRGPQPSRAHIRRRSIRRRLLLYPLGLGFGALTLTARSSALKAIALVGVCLFMLLPLALDALEAQRHGRLERLFAWLTRRRLKTTREGVVFLVLTILFGVAAINTGTNLLYLILSLLLSTIVASGILSESNVKGLRLVRTLPPAVFAGEIGTLYVTVHNPRRLIPSFIIEIAEQSGPFGPGGTPATGPAVLIPRLEPGERRTLAFRHRFERRGVFALEGLELRTRFPFGFFVKYAYARLPGELIVYPRVRALRRTLWERQAGRGGERRLSRLVERHGDSFHSLREYRPGDSRRLVHWRTSARLGALQVKQFEPFRAPRAAILVDRRLEGQRRRDRETRERLEAARSALDRVADLAASLTVALAKAGFELEVCVADGSRPLVMAGALGSRPNGRWLEALARLEAAPSGSDRDIGELRAAIAALKGDGVELWIVSARPAASLRAGGVDAERIEILDVSSPELAERYYEPERSRSDRSPTSAPAAACRQRSVEARTKPTPLSEPNRP